MMLLVSAFFVVVALGCLSRSWSRNITLSGRTRRLVTKCFRALAVALGLLVLVEGLLLMKSYRSENSLFSSVERQRALYLGRGEFKPLSFEGFVHQGGSADGTCDSLRYRGEIGVQDSFHLDDDLVKIAKSLEKHNMIDYSGQDQTLTYEQMISRTWLRLAGSAVWLEEYKVFLSVSRIAFYTDGTPSHSRISFLRGQIFDEDWIEQKNHTIVWRGEHIKFPIIFDIPTPFEPSGVFYGPEDPRMIIEEDVDNPEPVIVFNMMFDIDRKTRHMHVFRPFSSTVIAFTVAGRPFDSNEKNWAPFFHSGSEAGISKNGKRKPSRHVHFIYGLQPLTILECDLLNGWCETVYKQEGFDHSDHADHDSRTRMSGGTSLIPIPGSANSGSPGTVSYIGFPRTHTDKGDMFCTEEDMYRPEVMVLTARGNDMFHISYLSDALDFPLSEAQRADPCGAGRVLIPNSIARWDRTVAAHDVLTLTFSVADSTVQVLRLSGVANFVLGLPLFKRRTVGTEEVGGDEISETLSRLWQSSIGYDIRRCSTEAAQNYTVRNAARVNGMSLVRGKELETARAAEAEERKNKELDEARAAEADSGRREEGVIDELDEVQVGELLRGVN